MFESFVCTTRSNVTKLSFLDICNPISIGSFVFTTWKAALGNLFLCITLRRHMPAYFIAVPPNANRHTGVFSSCTLCSFLNTSSDRRLLMAPVSLMAFTSTCFVMFPTLSFTYASFALLGSSTLSMSFFLPCRHICHWFITAAVLCCHIYVLVSRLSFGIEVTY